MSRRRTASRTHLCNLESLYLTLVTAAPSEGGGGDRGALSRWREGGPSGTGATGYPASQNAAARSAEPAEAPRGAPSEAGWPRYGPRAP